MSESLRDLRMFVAACEERSFTAAAAREHATQSGVSQHIRKIEKRFGVRLFNRGTGSVVPTPAGDAYYRHAVEVLRAHECASRVVRGFGAGLEGEVCIGLMPTITRRALPRALARFTEAHPNATIRILEAYSERLTEQVRSGEISFSIVPAFPGELGLKSRLFLRTPELLVSRAGSRLEHMAPIRIADLDALKLVMPSAENTRRRAIESYLAANGVRPVQVLDLNTMLGTLGLIAITDWVAILPGVMMAPDQRSPLREFTINPLDPPLTLDLVLIEPSRHAMSPVAESFLDFLKQEAIGLIQDLAPLLDTPPLA